MKHEIGTVLFVAQDTPENLEEAREYIKVQGYTADDVKIVRIGEDILVKAKRVIEYEIETNETELPDKKENVIVRVIDFETTGIPDKDNKHSVIEAAYVDVKIEPGSMHILNKFETLVAPATPMDIQALATHHIQEEKALEEGWTWEETEKDLTSNSVICCAHNADFEKEFFNPPGSVWIDTYKVALKLWPDSPSHKNQVLKYYLGIENKPGHHPPHRALPDCFVTAEILMKALEKISVDEAIKISNEPPYLTRLNFGKHKGMKFEEVPRDYLEWCLGQADMDEGVKVACRRVLNGTG